MQALPPEMQEQAARMLLAYAGDEEPVLKLTPEEGDLIEARAEMRPRRVCDRRRGRGGFRQISQVRLRFQKRALQQIDKALGAIAARATPLPWGERQG